jgi:hypothetical protein
MEANPTTAASFNWLEDSASNWIPPKLWGNPLHHLATAVCPPFHVLLALLQKFGGRVKMS